MLWIWGVLLTLLSVKILKNKNCILVKCAVRRTIARRCSFTFLTHWIFFRQKLEVNFINLMVSHMANVLHVFMFTTACTSIFTSVVSFSWVKSTLVYFFFLTFFNLSPSSQFPWWWSWFLFLCPTFFCCFLWLLFSVSLEHLSCFACFISDFVPSFNMIMLSHVI